MKTKMNQVFALAIVALPLAFMVSGCEVKPAVAVRSEVAPTVAPDNFEAASVKTSKVTMFLWRDDVTPDQVNEVLSNSDEIDTKSLKQAHLKKDKEACTERLNRRFGKFKDLEINQADFVELRNKVAATKAELEVAQKDADEVEAPMRAAFPEDLDAACKKSGPKDSNYATCKKYKALDKQLGYKTKKGKAERLKNITLANDQKTLDEPMDKIRAAGLENEVEEWLGGSAAAEVTKIQQDFDLLGSEIADASSRVDDRVWLFQAKPKTFSLKLNEDGTFSAEITDWDLSNIKDETLKAQEPSVVQTFSTENGKIGPISYTPRGAIFKFDVTTSGATYGFKLWRSKYELSKVDGTVIFYQGEITRTSLEADGSTKVRRGSIKLEVTNNENLN